MNPPMLCPACLDELPDTYPFDHVAIDLTLTDQPERILTMSLDERREVVVTGLARGMTVNQLATRYGWSTGIIRALLPTEHPESETNARLRHAADRAALDTAVRALWEARVPDTDIALRTGRSVYLIADTRRRLGLPTHTSRRGTFSGRAR